jgi:hypothetical protein
MDGQDQDVDGVEADRDLPVLESTMHRPPAGVTAPRRHGADPLQEVDVDDIGKRDQTAIDPVSIRAVLRPATEQERDLDGRAIDDVEDADVPFGGESGCTAGTAFIGSVGELEAEVL